MIEVKGKHITVAGAARSGAAVAVLLSGKSADVFVTDNGFYKRSRKKPPATKSYSF